MTIEPGEAFGNDFVETVDEDGKKHLFEKVDEFEVDGQEYVLLIYQGENEDAEAAADAEEGHDEEVVVMRLHREDNGDVFEQIEDEAEFEKVIKFLEESEDEEVTIDLADILENLGGSNN